VFGLGISFFFLVIPLDSPAVWSRQIPGS